MSCISARCEHLFIKEVWAETINFFSCATEKLMYGTGWIMLYGFDYRNSKTSKVDGKQAWVSTCKQVFRIFFVWTPLVSGSLPQLIGGIQPLQSLVSSWSPLNSENHPLMGVARLLQVPFALLISVVAFWEETLD